MTSHAIIVVGFYKQKKSTGRRVFMISKELAAAREYESREGALVGKEERPEYHFSPLIGWLNDPNGFSFYDGKYHLFYQYHPYNSFWGPMHWGHAVSDDLISWEYLPAALAPDADYDGAGCFSGSAITLPDGRQLLMYTGCATYGIDSEGRWRQTQCIATLETDESGKSEYVKCEKNPVIADSGLTEDGDIYEFRDPYIFTAGDGTYRAVVANGRRRDTDSFMNKGAQVLMYRSSDCFDWEFDKVLFEDDRRIGVMWECPNFFPLDGVQVLLASPMDMQAEEANGSVRFPQGNNVCYILGIYEEEKEEFIPYKDNNGNYLYKPLDGGLDFYAPQVMKTPDGRTVLIGWMQDPSMANLHDPEGFKVFGQMTIPRELSQKDGRLYQWPVREIEAYRHDLTEYSDVEVGEDEITLSGVSGRVLDIEIEVRPKTVSLAGTCSLEELDIRFAGNDELHSEIRFRPDSSVITIDRKGSGQAENITRRRSIRVRDREGSISLRIMLDRYSAEIFVNGGEEVISVTYYTPLDADRISFSAYGSAVMDIKAYNLGKQDNSDK